MAIDLDGVNQSITVADDPLLRLQDMSIAIWLLKSSEPSLNFPRLIGKGTPEADGNYGIFHRNTDDLLLFQIRHAGVPDRTDVFGTTAIAQDTWYHVVGTYDSTADIARIYLNGEEENSTAGSGQAVVTSTDPVTMGTGLFSSFWPGLLDDARIYNSALSAAEIKTIYSAAQTAGHDGIVNGLVARYTLSEGAPGVAASGAGVIKDVGPNKFDGTPVNSPIWAPSQLSFRKRVA